MEFKYQRASPVCCFSDAVCSQIVGKVVRCNRIDIKAANEKKVKKTSVIFISRHSHGSKAGVMSSKK